MSLACEGEAESSRVEERGERSGKWDKPELESNQCHHHHPPPPPTPSFHCCFMEMLVHQICRRPDSFFSAFWSGISSALALRDNSRNLKGLLDAANNSAYTTMCSFLDFSVDAWALL